MRRLRPDVLRQVTLGALHQIEVDQRALLQGSETFHLHGRKMRKDISATALGLDEPETFGVIEPLHHTYCHD